MTIQRLKILVCRLFRINPRAVSLTVKMRKHVKFQSLSFVIILRISLIRSMPIQDDMMVRLDNDYRDLSYYCLESGDSIVVSSVSS